MKTKTITGGFLILLTTLAFAATNDLTSALQKGLFEEEANHNLEAAAQAYQTVSAQFDKDRKLAATAIFRLGEVYRKQGRTNEAVAQYERIVREFSDQQTLVTLSRQNLAAVGVNRPALESADALPGVSAASPEAQELARIEKILLQLKGWDLSQLRRLIPSLVPDADFERLEAQLKLLENYGTTAPEDVVRRRDEIKKLLQDRAMVLLDTLDRRAKALREIVAKQTAEAKEASSSAKGKGAVTAMLDDEEKEIRRIQALIQNSPDLINSPSEGGFTPLHTAASRGQLTVARFLLDSRANVNAKSANGETPLTLAAVQGHRAMVELLVGRGADVNLRAGGGYTALHQVALRGFLAVAEVLVANKADLEIRNSDQNGEATALHLAAGAGQTTLAEFLITKGANVNALDKNGQTPLLHAAMSGHAATVKALLAAKAAPNTVSSLGRTALSQAAAKGYLDVVKALLEAKADSNLGKLDVPLAIAARGKRLEVAEALLRAGADANLATQTSFEITKPGEPLLGGRSVRPTGGYFPYTPLQIAVAQRDVAMVKLLLKFKGDANAKVPTGSPPGPLTSWTLGDAEILKAFLDAGADANAAIRENWSLLLQASLDVNQAAVELLLSHGAKPNVVDESGYTPLSRAAGNTNIVKLLLEAKADPNLGTTDSPLLLAVRRESLAVAEMLLRAGANPNQETKCDLLNPTPAVPVYPGLAVQPVKPRAFTLAGQRGQRTPLQIAVLEEHPAMVKLLLQFKGDPKVNDPEGFPLVLSALDNAEMLKALLEAGDDANASDGKGRYALITSAGAGNSAAVDLLLAHGAKTEVRGEYGTTALLVAINSGSSNCVASLLAAGADVNVKNDNAWSALHYAVSHGRKVILQMLLDKGADPNVRNNEGKTPLDLTQPRPGFGVALPQRAGEIPRDNPNELAELLRKHGALDELPDFTSIRITRAGVPQPVVIFQKDTNSVNRFTLLEVVRNFYWNFSDSRGMPFPDFSKIIIHRPAAGKPGNLQEIPVNLLTETNSFDCTKDTWLEFGDTVEIPEREHTLAEPKGGITIAQDKELKRCLQGKVTFVVRGQTAEHKLDGSATTGWLQFALSRVQNLLRSSSDLSRIKIKRTDPITKQTRELIADSKVPQQQNVWLRDGDVIEVPDKP